MADLILFAAGSSLVVDYVESARRAGWSIAAAVRNVAGLVFTSADIPVVEPASLPARLLDVPHIVPLFTPAHRQSAVRQAEALGFSVPATLIDPTSILPAGLAPGPGCYINAGCTLGAASQIGAFVVINRGCSIGHHASIGDFVSIGPGAVLAGQVTLGAGSVIGAGAVVLPEVTVGRNAVVGAGAVVTRDVPDQTMVVGNPARAMRSDIGGYKGLSVD